MDFVVTNEKTFQKQISIKPRVRTQLRRVRLWTRLSPVHLLRVFVNNYVKGCAKSGKDYDVHASSFRVSLVCDDSGVLSSAASQSRSAQANPSAQELHDFSSMFSHQGSVNAAALDKGSALAGSVHLAQKRHVVITGCNGLTMVDPQGPSSRLHKMGASRLTTADLQGFSSPLCSSANAFSAAPESKQHSDTNVSKGGLNCVFQTSALHPTGFLQSTSRGLALGAHRVTPKGGSGRLRRIRSRSASSVPSVSPVALSLSPLTPVTDMSTFREQSHRQRPSRRVSSRSENTLAVWRPYPSRDFDARAPPPTAASPRPLSRRSCTLIHE